MKKFFLLLLLLYSDLFSFDLSYFIKSIFYKEDNLVKINSVDIPLNKNLKIYDATLYSNKKIENTKLFPKINLIYARSLWTNWNDVESRKFVDEIKITKIASKLTYSSIPYIIDIEHWDVHTVEENVADKNIDKYIKVISLFKKLRPDLKFGFYGVLPNRDYWSPVSNNPEKIKKWNLINNRLKRIAIHVDVICPSLYTFYNDKVNWNIYARENINRALEYNKPIYAFIWPQFHNSNKSLKSMYIDKSFWKNQLEILKDIDAIVIWGGWNPYKKNKRLKWNENENWWKITKEFINTNNLN